MLNMFNIEWLEALWSVLALISAALSVYLWKRAAAVPSLLDQPALTLAWRARLHVQAGSAAAFAVFFLILLMISQVIEAMSGTVPPTIA
jgi:NhaP-type Na+/H+ and K+/H+ antiporter